ncbi:hypothetical protein ACFXA2_06155, partial [Micromonospora chalcea]
MSTPREQPEGPPPILDPGTPRNGRPGRGPDGRFRQPRPPEERLGADPEATAATGLDEPLDPVEGPDETG